MPHTLAAKQKRVWPIITALAAMFVVALLAFRVPAHAQVTPPPQPDTDRITTPETAPPQEDDLWVALREGGVAILAEPTLAAWFPQRFHDDPAFDAAREWLLSTPLAGILGCGAAIAETDLYESTARLRLPTLAIAGSEDGLTPPDMVRETADLVPGSRFHLIRGAGHLPCVDKPQEFATALTTFLKETGHV